MRIDCIAIPGKDIHWKLVILTVFLLVKDRLDYIIVEIWGPRVFFFFKEKEVYATLFKVVIDIGVIVSIYRFETLFDKGKERALLLFG